MANNPRLLVVAVRDDLLTAIRENDVPAILRLSHQLPNTYTHHQAAATWQVIKTANYQRRMSPIESAIEKAIGNGIIPLEVALNS